MPPPSLPSPSSPPLASSPWRQRGDADVDTAALYRRVHSLAVPGQLVTALHMGAEHTVVATGLDAQLPSVVLTLALGSQKTARDFFRGALPTPFELETSIASVEDEVYAAHVRHRPWVPQGAVVMPCSTDPALHEIATLAGIAQGPRRVLTLDALEHVFNRLVSVSQGRPASHEGLPAHAAFAATLLVLRELMHHLPFPSLTLVDGA
jgi:hypothetical protein